MTHSNNRKKSNKKKTCKTADCSWLQWLKQWRTKNKVIPQWKFLMRVKWQGEAYLMLLNYEFNAFAFWCYDALNALQHIELIESFVRFLQISIASTLVLERIVLQYAHELWQTRYQSSLLEISLETTVHWVIIACLIVVINIWYLYKLLLVMFQPRNSRGHLYVAMHVC